MKTSQRLAENAGSDLGPVVLDDVVVVFFGGFVVVRLRIGRYRKLRTVVLSCMSD
jgi:hypothetical protein